MRDVAPSEAREVARTCRKALEKPDGVKRLRKAVEAIVELVAPSALEPEQEDDDDEDARLTANVEAATNALLLDLENGTAVELNEPESATAITPQQDFVAWYAAHLATVFQHDLETVRQHGPEEISRLAWAIRTSASLQAARLPESIKESLRQAEQYKIAKFKDAA